MGVIAGQFTFRVSPIWTRLLLLVVDDWHICC